MPLTKDRATEIVDLAANYGTPRRVIADLPFTTYDFAPLNKPDRVGEVCMVVRRMDGTLITARKQHYPPNTARLLTGGIGHQESIHAALVRETYEETGLETTINRFLAVIEYRVFATSDVTLLVKDFFTFAFLLDETGGILAPQDPHEKIAEYRFVQLNELLTIAESLDTLGTRHPAPLDHHLPEWGIFRAIAHRVVFGCLDDKDHNS